jgi:hypothetical protein
MNHRRDAIENVGSTASILRAILRLIRRGASGGVECLCTVTHSRGFAARANIRSG